MRGVLLAINQADAAICQKRHGAGKGDFGRIGAAGKHRLAIKHAADLHAVQPARQMPPPRRVGQPAFKAVRVSQAVQRGVGNLKIGRNPSAALLGAGDLRAGGNHFGKTGVHADTVAFAAQGFGERTPDVQPLGQQHGAGMLRKPVKQAVLAEPRENALAVRRQQHFGRERVADANQTVVLVVRGGIFGENGADGGNKGDGVGHGWRWGGIMVFRLHFNVFRLP